MAEKATTTGKRAKISKAQQYMLLAVLGASIALGVTLALLVHSIQQISFNSRIIEAQDTAIGNYTTAISTTGLCIKPTGDTYTIEELDKCNPSSLELSQIPNTLRSNVLQNLAVNSALNSVPKESSTTCINPDTNKNYTDTELNDIYNEAAASDDTDRINAATELIQSCSALRVIPDALPAFKNEEALLASLNKLFIDSGWQPESLSPGGSGTNGSLKNGLRSLSVNLSVEADTATTMRVLNNIERSIREFNIERATIEWSGDNTLTLQGNATAYYMEGSKIVEREKTIKPGEDKK